MSIVYSFAGKRFSPRQGVAQFLQHCPIGFRSLKDARSLEEDFLPRESSHLAESGIYEENFRSRQIEPGGCNHYGFLRLRDRGFQEIQEFPCLEHSVAVQRISSLAHFE